MFQETMSGSPSPEAVATAKAAVDVADGKVPLSTACKVYNVREQNVIQYIIDRTEYETILEVTNDRRKQRHRNINTESSVLALSSQFDPRI